MTWYLADGTVADPRAHERGNGATASANGWTEIIRLHEARKAPRRRVLQTGLVAYADLAVSFRCTIRDRSDTGARLRLPEGMLVPPRFWLIDIAGGVAYEAVTIWKTYPNVGIGFPAKHDLKVVTVRPMQRRLRSLWQKATPHADRPNDAAAHGRLIRRLNAIPDWRHVVDHGFATVLASMMASRRARA